MATQAELEAAVDDLQAKIEPLTTASQSAITLLSGLKQMLDDALSSGGTPQQQLDEIAGVSAAIGDATNTLAAAVAAHTPST